MDDEKAYEKPITLDRHKKDGKRYLSTFFANPARFHWPSKFKEHINTYFLCEFIRSEMFFRYSMFIES